ncbi:MAG: response regulator [Rhodoferax ferrireducens]|uniref:Response regulator n=1 Tax=Rhodoferax ferrireducens TaxID=192843 RepID=A0A1W9KQP2_9BURK|nr:MAG: response regulator [Rhodoferax ferrireducens]
MSHILVIDDDDFFREVLVQMLQKDGHQVTEARDGVQALALLQRTHPDLIMTDILMPHMDGVEFITELSRQSNNTPVIAMSGGRRAITAAFNLESAKLMGVKVTLSKPIGHSALNAALREILG